MVLNISNGNLDGNGELIYFRDLFTAMKVTW